MILALLTALISSPLATTLLTMFGAPAAGSVVMLIFNSKMFLGLAGHVMNLGKGLGVGLAMWAKTGPLKAIFGPFVYLFVFIACFVWSILDGIMSKLEGDNLKMAQALESAFLQGGSASRLGYVQSKIDDATNPTPAEEIQKVIDSPAAVLDAGQTAALERAIETGTATTAAELAQ